MLSLYPGGLTPTFSGGVGWEGLLVALVSAYNPLAVVPVAFGFGALDAGGSFVVASGVNATIAAVFEGTVALAVLVPKALLDRLRRQTIAATSEALEEANEATFAMAASGGPGAAGPVATASRADAGLTARRER